MALTFLDLLKLAWGDDFDTVTYDGTARQAIKDALGEIGRMSDLPADQRTTTINLVAGTASYSLPATSLRILGVFDANGIQLEGADQQDIDAAGPASGAPSSYALYGSSIVFYPTPSSAATLTMRYLGSVTLPTADTDVMTTVTGVPEDYLYGLVAFARARMFEKEDDFEAAQYWQARWEKVKAQLRGDVQRRDRSRVKRIPGMFTGLPSPRFRVP